MEAKVVEVRDVDSWSRQLSAGWSAVIQEALSVSLDNAPAFLVWAGALIHMCTAAQSVVT